MEAKYPPDVPYFGTNRLLVGSFTPELTKDPNPFIYMCKVQKEQGFPAIMKVHFGILQWFRYDIILLEGDLIQSFFSCTKFFFLLIFAAPAESFPKDPTMYGPFETFIGKGILTSQGETWRHHRTLMHNGNSLCKMNFQDLKSIT